ncbi:glycoside hydrolase 5 family protein [Luteipulveratus mongoliensis]|uniref:Glycosyl hydrolase n=1 Tax=Luteipulveratus mongoliensis TaxID=571913 RepID=A0A0K1JIQ9_9MICO|nr:hypothetical protein [Luteipulveratus mongoliensis]AKU16465.1 glycosyl hydrolase [Luteipulveratus mongoliensis]
MSDPTPHPTAVNSPLRLGANYVPSRGWFYSWLDLDLDDVRRDLHDLAALGMDHVRIFPVWPWIQPGRGHLRRSAVRDVVSVIRVAAELGLDVCVDLIQGHLSSFDFLPSWALTWHQGSVFEDARVREGLKTYVDVLSAAVAAEPNVFAITVGNEVNNLWPASSTTLATSRDWAAEMVGTIRTAAPGVQVVYSMFDDAFYSPGHPFGPGDATALGDVTSVHSWIFNGTSRLDGPLGPATVSHAAYLCALASACAEDPGRGVWLQEIGAPSPDVPVGDAEVFVERTVEAVTQLPELTAITWWCSHDIDRGQPDFPEREYDLGLVTVDHVAKPIAYALRDAVRQARTQAPSPSPRTITAPADIVASPEDRAAVAPGSAFHRAWVEASQITPARIVLPATSGAVAADG